jgi:hypothetical protein
MARQLIVPLRSNGSAQDILPSVKPVIEDGVKTKLLRVIAMLSRYVRGQRSRQMEESYIARKSRDEESRLEFQRFLHW